MNPENRKSIQLQQELTAVVNYQDHMPTPFWIFGFEDDKKRDAGEGEYYQVSLLSSNNPDELLYQGISTYDLPAPLDEQEAEKFLTWAKENAPEYLALKEAGDYEDDDYDNY